ncbi:N-acetylmuramoyl-L-alanine amidase family protein [Desulfohalovibrio reitneri]|uniref:N-acetylmuramoyl-L-alanine amidase family protein n=1 Tax=Desulfohalovibrio reitneri TaxID=1307759 RepID=UPI0013775107|nr:N-acetylmuramoyl-L-alanine amidase [Desulfohalovibrio reitneri]
MLLLTCPAAAFAAKGDDSRGRSEVESDLSPHELALAGQSALSSGEWAEAAEKLRRSVRGDPRNEWAWSLLGRAERELGRLREARRAFTVAVRLNPEDTYSRMSLLRLKQFAESAESLREAPVAEPLPERRVGRIVLDAGHGGAEEGDDLASGPEKDAALELVRDIARHLRDAGYEVWLTRDGDYFLSLAERVAEANRLAPGVFVSLHVTGGEEATGIYSWSQRPRGERAALAAKRENASRRLAPPAGGQTALNREELLERFTRRGHHRATERLVSGLMEAMGRGAVVGGSADFLVLRRVNAPALLVEVPAGSSTSAESLASGLLATLGGGS